MKKLLSCVLVLFILFINAVPCFAANPTLSVGVSDYYVDPGKTITVNVNLSGSSGLGTLEFSVNFNPSEFEYVAGSGKTSGLFDMEEFNSTYGAGTLAFVGVATESVTAGGSVVSFKLKALKNGGVISLTVNDATDAEENPVTVTKSSVKLNCAHGLMKWTVTQEPTCMLYGKEEGVCSCGYTEKREIKPNDNHTFTDSTVITEPTCTKTGVKIGACSVCKQEGAKSVIPALGHDFSDWTVTKEPTDTTLGIKERTCKACKEKETQMISPTGDVQDEPTSDEMPTDEPVIDEPTAPTTEPDYNNYYEIETEPTTENNGLLGKLFGDNIKGSNVALVAVTGLTVLIVGFLIAYLVLLRKKK